MTTPHTTRLWPTSDEPGSRTVATATRATFAAWAEAAGRPWRGVGCPGGCRERGAAEITIRVALGAGTETWVDRLVGPCSGDVVQAGDPVIRDRHGNWTYGFAVVVDDARHGVDLVVRGRDLLDATPMQIRLAARLGRAVPPVFAHHPLIRRPDGRKLSKADGATAVRDLRQSGRRPEDVIGEAAAAVGLMHAPDRSRPRRSRASSARPSDTSGRRAVLDLPGVVEDVPGDPPCGVPRRPLAARDRRPVRRLAEDRHHGRAEVVDRRTVRRVDPRPLDAHDLRVGLFRLDHMGEDLVPVAAATARTLAELGRGPGDDVVEGRPGSAHDPDLSTRLGGVRGASVTGHDLAGTPKSVPAPPSARSTRSRSGAEAWSGA